MRCSSFLQEAARNRTVCRKVLKDCGFVAFFVRHVARPKTGHRECMGIETPIKTLEKLQIPKEALQKAVQSYPFRRASLPSPGPSGLV
jgi:hypothetical protein